MLAKSIGGIERREGGKDSGCRRRIDLVFHAEAFAFDHDGLGTVEHAIQDRGRHPAVVIEDFGPTLEGLVGGDDNGATFVALADDLEEQVGADLVERKIAELIDGQDLWAEVFLELSLQALRGMSGDQCKAPIRRISRVAS